MWLNDRLKEFSKNIAIISDDVEFSYAELVERINYYRTELTNCGIKSGHKVIVISEFSFESVSLIIAIITMKCVYIPISAESNIELRKIKKISGCDWEVSFNNENRMTIKSEITEVKAQLIENISKENEAAMVLFSSGSTGEPKGIVYRLDKTLSKFIEKKRPTIAIPFLLMDHFGGFNTIMALLSSGSQIITISQRSVDTVLNAIEKHNVELFPTTPSFLSMIVASELWQNKDLSRLKRITYGTEIMPKTLLNRVSKIFPHCTLQQTYGLSEVGVLRTRSKSNNSIGIEIGGPGFDFEIRNNILWIKSEYSMEGYLNAPSPFDNNGWMNTQDVVELDGEFIIIKGRNSDIINVGGQKVYPSEVEDAILEINEIEDVVVYGEENILLGQSVACRVKCRPLEDNEKRKLKKRIRTFCKSKLAPFKVPVRIQFTSGEIVSPRQKKIRR